MKLEKCKTAGVKVVMITGDHPLTAFSIAKNLNIANKNVGWQPILMLIFIMTKVKKNLMNL